MTRVLQQLRAQDEVHPSFRLFEALDDALRNKVAFCEDMAKYTDEPLGVIFHDFLVGGYYVALKEVLDAMDH